MGDWEIGIITNYQLWRARGHRPYQLPTINYQLSTLNSQLSIVNSPLNMLCEQFHLTANR
ncbi:MAG: hypothetical protein ACRC62_30565 [Microcoleus sp.]